MPFQLKQAEETGLFTGQKVRQVVECQECAKPRCIYANHELTSRQETKLVTVISEDQYTCGAPLIEPGDAFYRVTQCRLNITCGDPIEMSYYSSKFCREICCYCGEPGERSEEKRKCFKTVLPVCSVCKSKGLQPITARPYGPQKSKKTPKSKK